MLQNMSILNPLQSQFQQTNKQTEEILLETNLRQLFI